MTTHFTVYNDYNALFNKLYDINAIDTHIIQEYNVPVSTKYFITIMNPQDVIFNSFNDFINDDERKIASPFNFNSLDKVAYALEFEKEQFFQIDVKNSNIIKLNLEFEQLNNIIEECNHLYGRGSLIFVLDIDFLINLIIESNKNNIPTHIVDFLIFKFSQLLKLESILILDINNKYHPNNLLYEELKYSCLINTNKYINKFPYNIIIFKSVDDLPEYVYWNLLSDINLIDSKICVIKSPIRNIKYVELVLMNNKQYFKTCVNIYDILNTNVFTLVDKPGIVLDVIDKINLII